MLVRYESVSNVTVVKLVVLENTQSPILVTLAGMIIDVKADA